VIVYLNELSLYYYPILSKLVITDNSQLLSFKLAGQDNVWIINVTEL